MNESLPIPVQNLRKIWDSKKLEMEFTQVTASKKLGWSQGAISHYLNDVTELNPSAIIKFANFLDVDRREIDPEIETNLPSVTKLPVLYDANDMTAPLYNTNVLDRKLSDSIIVRISKVPKDINFGPWGLTLDEIYMKLTKVSQYSSPKLYAARLKKKKNLHIYTPGNLPDGKDIHTLWAVVSCTFH